MLGRLRASRNIVALSCLFVAGFPCAAQAVIGSARVRCTGPGSFGDSGPIIGAIINQTNITITDLEVELSIITRDKKGRLKRQRDTRYAVVPSLNQVGIVTKLPPKGNVYFSIPANNIYSGPGSDLTCETRPGETNDILNVAAIAITRMNGKSLLPKGENGKTPKQAPLEWMLQVPREPPAEHVPTQSEVIASVIASIRQDNELMEAKIANRQLHDCLSSGTWACTYNNATNINVVISQQ